MTKKFKPALTAKERMELICENLHITIKLTAELAWEYYLAGNYTKHSILSAAGSIMKAVPELIWKNPHFTPQELPDDDWSI